VREFIGQRGLLERLGREAARGNIAHAYAFIGPPAIGKRTAALRLAQTLNCIAAEPTAGGCGICLACRKIERGSHPDVLSIVREAERKDIAIEQVRAVRQDLALRPLEGRRRVVILDDAAELNEFGQDALLKTLEEPPPHAVLLLLTARPSRLQETILSRAQPLPFRPVPAREIADALALRFGPDAARHATAAAGRPGVAIRLASDEALRAERRALEAELFRLLSSGLTDRFAWAAGLAEDADPRRRAGAIEVRFDAWAELLRDGALAAGGRDDRPLRPERRAEIARLAGTVGARELVDAALLLQRLRGDLTYNANARAMLELAALRLPYAAELKGAA
jgi:DNA polymerase-3 subunit delta'